MATVNLRFDPYKADARPPKPHCLWSKLKVATYYSSVPLRAFPKKATSFQFDASRGVYIETVPLSCRNVESAQWVEHRPAPRRDSACSVSSSASCSDDSSIPAAASADLQLPFYTAKILVPISLPTNKSFVPSFHTCLLSRTYTLDLALASHSAPTLNLRLPIEVSAEGNADAVPVISPEEAASIARREAYGVFIPRSIAPPTFDEARGARGSIFTPRGSLSAGGLLGDSAIVDDTEPPVYTALGRSARAAVVES